MNIRVSMIAAVAENGVIGNGPDIPWRISSDFRYFKRRTMGKPVIMGRKTFESIGKPLPGRTMIVVSRKTGYQPDGVIVIDDFTAAVDHAKSIAAADGADEVMIAGGAEIYRLGMAVADRLYISHVQLEPTGEVIFPGIDPDVWQVIERPEVVPSEKDEASYAIKVYERR